MRLCRFTKAKPPGSHDVNVRHEHGGSERLKDEPSLQKNTRPSGKNQ